jgi:hypothetical protein
MSCNSTLHDIFQVLLTNLICAFPSEGCTTVIMAPAGGAVASAPEGCALACPSTLTPTLLVVGTSYCIAVPCLARVAVGRGESDMLRSGRSTYVVKPLYGGL